MQQLRLNVNEINRLHKLAQASAYDAVEYAKQAVYGCVRAQQAYWVRP